MSALDLLQYAAKLEGKSLKRESRNDSDNELTAEDYAMMTLGEFIEAQDENWKAPVHLGEYYELMSDLSLAELRCCVSMAPQHGKTNTILCAAALQLLRDPCTKIAYASHAESFSEEQSRLVRDIYTNCGGKIKKDQNKIAHWKTEENGGFVACSWKTSLVGKRVDVMICDDLIKDAEQAESHTEREHIWRWVNGVMKQRLWVGGSIIVIGSRWHYDDPIGRLIRDGYREICLPAIRVDADGVEHALWPEIKSLEWLNTLRTPSSPDYVGEHAWSAAYLGKPIPRTGSLFGPARYYNELPPGAKVVQLGIDIATTASNRSDWSTAVAIAEHNGIYYVHDVRRVHQVIVDVERTLKQFRTEYPEARMSSYVAGQERGIFDLMYVNGLEVDRLPAVQSKWTRSQRCALAWKTGKILVRSNQPWTNTFIREVEFFTGEDGGHDDQVDALVSAFDAQACSAPVGWVGGGFLFGSACM